MAHERESSPTPAPWSLERDRTNGHLDGITSSFTIYGAPGSGIVGYTVNSGEPSAREEGNAEHIVRCVNERDHVLRALADLREACTDAYKTGRIPAEPFLRAGNVLALARGEEPNVKS